MLFASSVGNCRELYDVVVSLIGGTLRDPRNISARWGAKCRSGCSPRNIRRSRDSIMRPAASVSPENRMVVIPSSGRKHCAVTGAPVAPGPWHGTKRPLLRAPARRGPDMRERRSNVSAHPVRRRGRRAIRKLTADPLRQERAWRKSRSFRPRRLFEPNGLVGPSRSTDLDNNWFVSSALKSRENEKHGAAPCSAIDSSSLR